MIGVDCLEDIADLQSSGEFYSGIVFSDSLRALERQTDNGAPMKLPNHRSWEIQPKLFERLLARVNQDDISAQVVLQLLYALHAQIVERDFEASRNAEKQAWTLLSVFPWESGYS